MLDLVFETADGFLTCGTVADAEWRAFARVVGHPEWADDPRFATPAARVANWDERLERMQQALRARPAAEWLELLDAADVPCAPILGRREVLSHPQILANELIVEGDHPHAGPMRQTRPPARFSRTPAAIRRPAPLLGEHSAEVLSEIGVGAGELAELRASGVVS